MTWISELANKLSSEGRASEIVRELEQVDPARLPDTEREEWWHIYGLTAFEGGRDDVALQRFRQGYDRFPDSPMVRFALGQQYIRAKEPDKGFALFRRTMFPQIPQQHALAEARYAYLHSRYDDARRFIRPFFDAYKNSKILDDNFLYMRGLPFFGRFWKYLAALSVLSGDWTEIDEVTAYVRKNCSDYDFDRLLVERDAYHNGEAARLLPTLRIRQKEISGYPALPTGFTGMTIAVIEARESQTLAAAQHTLESVALAKNDFPWLEDVRALAVADAAHRFGEAKVERERLETVLKRQPLLLEPNIALEFWLLGPQERLKADLLQS